MVLSGKISSVICLRGSCRRNDARTDCTDSCSRNCPMRPPSCLKAERKTRRFGGHPPTILGRARQSSRHGAWQRRGAHQNASAKRPAPTSPGCSTARCICSSTSRPTRNGRTVPIFTALSVWTSGRRDEAAFGSCRRGFVSVGLVRLRGGLLRSCPPDRSAANRGSFRFRRRERRSAPPV